MIDCDIERLFGSCVAERLDGSNLIDIESMGVAGLRQRGVGPKTARRVLSALSLGKRMLDEESYRGYAGSLMSTPEAVFKHYRPKFVNLKRERFYVTLLTARNRVIRDELISEGSLTASVVHPREVFRPIVLESAAGVIFVHNHPSGDPSPSREDIDITHRLRSIADIMGVRVQDHVVVGHDRFFSFNSEGLL